MTDKPCTHCGGSGKEPDPIWDAYEKLRLAIATAGPESRVEAQAAALGLHRAAVAVREQGQARITFLEAALRDMLGHFPERVTADELTSRWVKPEDLDNWRAVLDDTPGRLNADGSCKQHDFQPAPVGAELGHLGVHHCTRCGARWLPAQGELP